MKKCFGNALKAVTICAGVSLSSFASAAIIGQFEPAIDGVNSFKSSDGVSTFSNTTATTGFWHDRPTTFNIADIVNYPDSGAYQGQNTSLAQTHNEVVTTLTGLLAGRSYGIDIVYGVNTTATGGNQHIDAGFTSGSLTTFTEAAGTPTGLALNTANWSAVQQSIGTAVADGSGNIKVYVGATPNAERSVYNGLAYTLLPVPEPTSLVLFGLGLVGAIAAFRRQSSLPK